MEYDLNIEKFQGPLDKLLELIDSKKLSITEISLAEVTEDFLKYLEVLRAKANEEGVSREHMRIVADFLVVASRLVLIKSRSLLPDLSLTEEEEEDIKELEQRLRIHKRIREAEKVIAELWQAGGSSASRSYFLRTKDAPKMFYPGSNITAESLEQAMAGAKKDLERFVMATETIEEVIISLEERMEEVLVRMSEAKEMSLNALSKDKTKAETIAVFLAILHLAREQAVIIEQAGKFSDIIIKHAETESRDGQHRK